MASSRRRPAEFVVGVDVGTGSARAGVFDLRGRRAGAGVEPIAIFRPKPDHVEHSSRDIWAACGRAVRKALREGGVRPASVVGVGYDATCSLVALGPDDGPVTVSTTGKADQNVVVWMDHRAKGEADEINRTQHAVLRYVGGALSPEMEPPKLLWLKRNLPKSWKAVSRFLDLADFLVARSTGADVRSLCTTVCKWTYLGHEGEGGRWDRGFFERAGLGDVLDRGLAGTVVRPMGMPVGSLTPKAAKDLGLTTGAIVGVGIIDAHAGGLGVIGAAEAGREAAQTDIEATLALIGGTSSCHMAVSPEARYIPGVWGPYYGAMIPGLWLTEGGQSATGALLDWTIGNHARSPELAALARKRGGTPYAILNGIVAGLQKRAGGGPELTRHLHVYPDHHGNRSPRADARAVGMASGLTLDASLESLALLYYATVQAVAYGTRHIVDTLNRHGYALRRMHACGGGTKNPLWLQEHADVTGCTIGLPEEPEAVLLGSAILGAVASRRHADIPTAMRAMTRLGGVVRPRPETKAYHDAKMAVFHRMYGHQIEYRGMMTPQG